MKKRRKVLKKRKIQEKKKYLKVMMKKLRVKVFIFIVFNTYKIIKYFISLSQKMMKTLKERRV